VLRLFIFPFLLLGLTVGSVTILLGIKSLPTLISSYPGLFEVGVLQQAAADELPVRAYFEQHDPGRLVNTVNRIALFLLGGALLAFLALNLPFRHCFAQLRRGRLPRGGLHAFCRRWIFRTPYLNGGIFAAPFLILFAVIWILEARFTGGFALPEGAGLPVEGYRNLRYLLLTSALLSGLFILVWQRHRVRMHYLKQLFTAEELRVRRDRIGRESIRGRLWLSSITTTLLPFATVVMYVALSFTVVEDFGRLPRSEQQVLLGRYATIVEQLGAEERFYGYLREVGSEELPPVLYINVVDSLQMLTGVAGGLTAAFIYLFFFVRWMSADIAAPVRELQSRMQRVAQGDMDAYVRVRSGDELGELGEGFNAMLDGLRDRERIKGLFGQYLTPEVSDEILRGGVETEGAPFDASVLFADIRGFTAQAEKMEPQEVVRFLNGYFELMIEVVLKHGGIIDKFLGDGLLAVFGVPVPRDDHAERAVNAALAMHRSLGALNRRREGAPPIDIGIGIHSGTVIAGNLGSEKKLEYTVIGDTVNLASRIEGLNKRFSTALIISETAYARLPAPERVGGWQHIPAVAVRGRREPVDLYALSGQSIAFEREIS
jgi:class 3 adenylate cyclase